MEPSSFQDDLYISVTTLGELYFGAFNSARTTENLRRVDEFASRTKILATDPQTGRLFGEIKEKLRKKGKPIPDNNIWIASVAMQYSLTLVTRDSHFNHVDALSVERR